MRLEILRRYEIVEYPKYKACRIWLAAGGVELTERMLCDIEAWAKGGNCYKIEIVGRRGWLRVLTDSHQPHTVLEKILRVKAAVLAQ